MGVQRKGRYTLGYRTKADIRALTLGVAQTGTLTTSGTTLTGSGTTFTNYEIGDVLRCSDEQVIIATITDDTNATVELAPLVDFAAESFDLMNPKRIKRGMSVFNITDRIAMTYVGDGEDVWQKGEFSSGQCARIRNAFGNGTLTEGEVCEPSTTVNAGMVTYNGTIDHALGVVYFTVNGGSALPLAVCGIHNTDENDAGLTKGEYCVPDASVAALIGDGTSASSDQCAVAMTDDGASEFEAFLNFLERL
jgi:hypothetical protein